jgi:DNA-directed RNA polymerase specialized sigma24 family protein
VLTNALALEPLRDIEQTVSLAFRTAHLLTASTQQAESAVLEAIDSFDPDVDTGETLFQNAILGAVQCPSSQSQSTESFEPPELQAVLSLSENLRRCFVLRVLVGLSRRSCARLLRLNAGTVNDYTCAALQRLARVDR